MGALSDLLSQGTPAPQHRPWPRATVGRETWHAAIIVLAADQCTLLGLWGEPAAVHMALLDEQTGSVGVLSHDCPDGRFPSVGRLHPPAQRPERAARDLYGLQPQGGDGRPWLDHGRWDLRHPLAAKPEAAPIGTSYAFLAAEGESLHQIPVGPVHAGIIEPGHFRFTCSGETVVRLEQRLGYVHKGVEGLMAGAGLDDAARIAARTSGDATVAYGIAFARAAEAALGIEAPPRAAWLRALMAELERIANHLGDIGAVCNDASFGLMHAHCGVLREQVLRAAGHCFGHRLMRDRVVPGGVACDLDAEGVETLRALVAEIRRHFPPLVRMYDETTSLQDRTVGTGRVSADLVGRFGAGGHVGRASGRGFDARRALAYPPYDALDFAVPVREEGDVNARVWVRIDEVGQSLGLVDQILERLPAGALRTDVRSPGAVSEGMALAESFRGDVLAWLRLDADGRVARCHLRDPSWFQWPLLEAAIEGNIVADFPLCNKSFNCSYSGHDL